MLRRIVSLGQQASESDEPMSPSTEDAAPDARSTGGLASVFKGLTGGRLTKSPPPPVQTAVPAAAAAAAAVPSASSATISASDCNDASSASLSGLPPQHMDAFELLRGGSPSERISAAEALRVAISSYPLGSVLGIWYAGKDLIDPGKSNAARIAGWGLVTECVKHTESTDLERREYFQTLSALAHPDDFHLQLAAFVDLTKRGRDLSGFEYEAIPLLTIWLQDSYKAVKAARKLISRSGRASKGKLTASGEEKNLSQLFAFLLDVVKNSQVTDDRSASNLISALLDICISTSVEEDLKVCIGVVHAIHTYLGIPADTLARCVKVLSSIYSMVPTLEKSAWQALGAFFNSHHGQPTVMILLDVLRELPSVDTDDKELHREVRGALAVLQKLVWKTPEKGYPQVPLNPLVDGLVNIANRSPTPRICALLLRLINSLFDDGDCRLNAAIADEDWAVLFAVAAECSKSSLASKKRNGSSPEAQQGSTKLVSSPRDEREREDYIGIEVERLVSRLGQLLFERRSDFIQRQDCIVFFTKIHLVLPDSAAGLVLDYFDEFHCCFPSDLQWEDNLRLVLDSFYRNRERSTLIRSRALKTITAVVDILELIGEKDYEYSAIDLIKCILEGVSEETDTVVLQETVSFMVSVSTSADLELFDYIVGSLKGVVGNDRLRPPLASPPGPAGSSAAASSPEQQKQQRRQQPQEQDLRQGRPVGAQSPSNVVTRGYVQMFMRSMNTDVWKATTVFKAILNIARSKQCELDARLTAMKMLFRLRADWENRVFLTIFTESESLAAGLFRTEASLARKLAEDAQHTRPSVSTRSSRAISFGQGATQAAQDRGHLSRSTSGASASAGAGAPSLRKYRQLWSLPDPDALPETPSSTSSPVLLSEAPVSRRVESGNADDQGAPDEQQEQAQPPPLGMAAWLEALLSILSTGCDWEIYSFILVHLPSQLSNHAIFKAAIPQVQALRGVVCEMIRRKTFQEPPSALGLRKSEVAICVYHILTMIMSYHRHFQKNEEDEIVQTFMGGISDKSARCCIHALSMCCHELPLSTSKCLVAVLQRMSQIITQQGVAIHILEFLACLSRLPALYSNFREDEYRIVFGICFRYLQDVRSRRAPSLFSASSSPAAIPEITTTTGGRGGSSQNSSDDLPQYVYALAYHVITFWFLALKLPDRANHVGWIAKNLFSDAEGGPADEQAQITLDFMQRVAFADGDGDSVEDPLFTHERFGEITERRWIIANSIVTIKQATKSGWAQVTKRQPSGTSCFVVRENVRPPPSHQGRISDTELNGGGGGGGGGDVHASLQLGNTAISPSHVLVQLLSSMPQAHDSPLRPIPLPDDEAVARAIRMFDRSPTVDGHKVGVIYIGEGQTREAEMLANISGSQDYVEFLNGLGTLVKLKGASFNTQGLDREYDTDGQFTFAWRDRVTEMVFHVTTQMPTNLEHDPNCVNKKRHIGNDFVNIIFNDSGLPFRFDTFPSDFNYVNIVITPVSRASFVATRERYRQRKKHEADASEGGAGAPVADQPTTFYKVQVMSKPGFPEISPAADTKMVSLRALPDFIRLLALNASVFSLVWSSRAAGEHVSAWRNRLREISRLRDRYGPPKPAPAASPPPPPMTMSPQPLSSSTMGTGGGGLSLGAGGGGMSGAANGATAAGVGAAAAASHQHNPLSSTISSSSMAPASASASTLTDPNPAFGGMGSSPFTGGGSGSAAVSSSSRPTSSMRDSFSSLRRSSVATFFTTASETATTAQSHRSSVMSTATTEGTEIIPGQPASALDALVDSLDFSKWA